MVEQVQQTKPAQPKATMPATKPAQPVGAAGTNPAMPMEGKSIFKKWWFWVIVAIVVIGIGLGIYLLM